MCNRSLSWLAGLLAACVLVGGCGPITAQSLLMKGAMWAGKEVIKKEYKKHKERDHKGEPATHSRHDRPVRSNSKKQPSRQAPTSVPSQQ